MRLAAAEAGVPAETPTLLTACEDVRTGWRGPVQMFWNLVDGPISLAQISWCPAVVMEEAGWRSVPHPEGGVRTAPLDVGGDLGQAQESLSSAVRHALTSP